MFKLEEGWLTVGLLGAMITVAGWGVAAGTWTEGLWVAWIIGVVGVFAGLALAKSRFSGAGAAFFAAVYGAFCVGFFICLLLKGTWHERSIELVLRLNTFLYKALHSGTSRDTLPFPVLVGLIFWACGVTGAWAVFRRNAVWPAVLPAGVGLLVNAYYYLGPARVDLYLAVYVVLALMLMAQLSLVAREREWRSARVAYSPDMRLDFLRAGLIVALAGVLIGWATPNISTSPEAAATWQQVTRSWPAIRETWVRLFSSVRAQGQTTSDFYGESLTLGGPVRLSSAPIMDVTLALPDDFGPSADAGNPIARYYWRAAAWDQYTDGRWLSSGAAQLTDFDPSEPAVSLPAYQLRRDVRAVVLSHLAASTKLYVLPQPRWVDRPARFELAVVSGGAADVISVRSRDILRRGQTYQVVASVTVADQASLRAAGVAYPVWVRAGFLQVPATVTDRTRALAQQIVDDAGAVTPYDKAQAITDWLRANITYDQEIAAPPPNVEPVDYLLFVSRRGYCNYYASAEVLLLRSLGIPARLAVGFAQGEVDPETGVYHVLENNAHAWPEVFFPNYGWVEFEPTASEPPLVRPERPPETAPADDTSTLNDEDRLNDRPGPEEVIPEEDLAGGASTTSVISRLLASFQRYTLNVLIGLAAAGVIATLAAGLMLRLGLIGWENLGGPGRWVLRSRGLPVPSAITAAYLQLERAARWLGLSFSEAFTPHERSAALGQAVPEAREGVATITDHYVAERYSPHTPDGAAARVAWRGIRLPFWREGLRTFLRRLNPKHVGQLVRRPTRSSVTIPPRAKK